MDGKAVNDNAAKHLHIYMKQSTRTNMNLLSFGSLGFRLSTARPP